MTKDLDNDFATLNPNGYSIELQEDEKTVLISADNLDANVIWEDEYTGNNVSALQTDAGDVLKTEQYIST